MNKIRNGLRFTRLGAIATLALIASFTGSALAGAGLLGPGDEQLASGEYFDRVIFSGNAGDQIIIELSSTEFDPYVMILDSANNAITFQDDGPGAGLNVSLGLTLPTSGQFTVLVTSAVPGESGRYSLTLSAAGQAAAGGTEPAPMPAAGANSITGTAYDTNGQPLADARVRIVPALTTGDVEVRTDSNGRYLVESLPEVPYRARAWIMRDYGGDQVCLRLGMESPGDFDSFSPAMGVVRNFHWQLTGPIEGQDMRQGTFGGTLLIGNSWMYEDAGNQIELSFTPAGPLIDGSAGSAFTRTLNPDQDMYLYDIPVGPYQLEATLVAADGSRQPLQLSENDWDSQATVPAMTVDWVSSGDCSLNNGWEWTTVYVW